MTIALGGQYNRWNDPLHVGFWEVILSAVFCGIGYICFAVCMAEICSTLPFSGGIYGSVRAFIGPFAGYVVSRFEIVMVICYLAALVQSLGTFPTLAGISPESAEPAWWLFYFVTAIGIASIGCNYVEYWAFIKLIGGFSLLLLIMYILGSFDAVNFDKWGHGGHPLTSSEFFPRIYQTAGMYRGMQYLPLVSIKLADVSTDKFS